MGMAAISFNDAEPFEQNVNIPSTEGPMWNLVKIGQVVLEKTFKDFMILYTGAMANNPRMCVCVCEGRGCKFWS